MKDIFESHSVKTLKGEISKYNKLTKVAGYSKMKKKDLVDLMLKNKEKFKHIKMNPKPLKELPTALTQETKSATPKAKHRMGEKPVKKEEPKKEEPTQGAKPHSKHRRGEKPVKKVVKKESPKKDAPNIASNFIKKSVDKLKKIKKGEFQKLRDAEREIRNESIKFNQIQFSIKDRDKLKEELEKEKKRISPPAKKEDLEKLGQAQRELQKRIRSRRKDGTFVFNPK